MSSTFTTGQTGHTAEHNRLGLHGYDVTRYGAVGNGSTDCTAAIQAAIDDAANDTNPGRVVFPPGRYVITANLQWKSCDLVGLGSPNVGVRIIWNGSAGGTALTRTMVNGGMSFGLLSNILFVAGSAAPAIWVDLTAGAVDALLQIERCHFNGSTTAAIDMSSFVNVHWRNLRFDNCGGHAIRATPAGSQFLCSLVLDQFTYDHNRVDNLGQGVILVDNSANASNLGTVTLRGGRIELNEEWSGHNAIATVKLTISPNPRTVGVHLSDVTFQDVTGLSAASVLRRDTANTTGGESLLLTNFRQSGIASDALVSGGWAAGITIPTLAPNTGSLSLNQSA